MQFLCRATFMRRLPYEKVAQVVQSQEELSVYCQFLSCAEPDSSQTASWATNHISLVFKSYALRLSKTHEIMTSIKRHGNRNVKRGIRRHIKNNQCFEAKPTRSSSCLILWLEYLRIVSTRICRSSRTLKKKCK